MLPVGLDPDCEADGIRPPGRSSEDFMPGIKPGRQYNFWGTIAVTEVTDFEASLLVQSHASHEPLPYWPR
jgi:hypothetical protein